MVGLIFGRSHVLGLDCVVVTVQLSDIRGQHLPFEQLALGRGCTDCALPVFTWDKDLLLFVSVLF
jgi:hypothetical protein